jgi:hypothetical protein
MPILKDARGNEFQGSLDQITGGLVTDPRAANVSLAALNAEAIMDLNGQAVAAFDIRTAAANLTLVFEVSLDGVNYFAVPAFIVSTTLASPFAPESMVSGIIITTTHTGLYVVGVSGYRRVRVRVSAFTSGTVTVTLRASQSDFAIYSRPIPSILHVTAVAAVNTALTATLPAVVGQFHYITSISLRKLYNVIGVAAGAGVTITTTNLPGTPAYTTEQLASAAGSVAHIIDDSYAGNPLKSLTANTATTFVAPAQLQTIWRWNVSYYTGA